MWVEDVAPEHRESTHRNDGPADYAVPITRLIDRKDLALMLTLGTGILKSYLIGHIHLQLSYRDDDIVTVQKEPGKSTSRDALPCDFRREVDVF